MLLIQVLLIQVSTIIIFDNLYVQNQSTTTAQALARTKTRMTTWLNSNFRGRWKEVSGPNVTLASNQWMIVMRIGKQGGNYDYHYWYRTNDGPWANKHGQTPSVLLPASDMPTTNSSSGWTLNGKTGFYNSSIVYCQLLSEYVISCACVPLCYSQCKQRRHRGVGNMLPLWNVGGQRHCGVDRAALMRGWESALLSDDPKQQGLQRRIQSFSHQQRPENLVISAAFGDAECLAEGWVPL